jgi:hypothetical protein
MYEGLFGELGQEVGGCKVSLKAKMRHDIKSLRASLMKIIEYQPAEKLTPR